MKDARIGKLRSAAEKDLRISHAAMRLLFRIYSDRYLDPHAAASDVFVMPWTQVSHWLGLSDKHHCLDITDTLVSGGYLFSEGVRGCPPTRAFKLNLKYNPTPFIKGGIISGAKRKAPLPSYVRNGLAALRAVKNQ
jgi:hypothetical protein